MALAPTILITGATGFIGGHLAARALERGLEVRTLTRSEWSGSPAVAVDQRFFGTLPLAIPRACFDGIETVVHCAAWTGAGSEREAEAVNVLGTAHLARAAAAAGVRRFVFLSSQSARRDAAAAYGRTKYAAEQALADLAGIETIVIRPGLVCGPGSTGLYQRMRALVQRLPLVPLLGGGRALVQPIHVDDLSDAILRAAAGEIDGAGPLELGDPEGLSLADFLRAISRAQRGRPKRTIAVPLLPVQLAVGLGERLRVPLPVTSASLAALRSVERMDTAPHLARAGLQPRPIGEIVGDGEATVSPETALERRAVGAILIGGGRIGLLHAITATRQRGLRLAAVVDTKRSALRLLEGIGIRTTFTTDLDAALALPEVGAAIIATPVNSHLPLARRCLDAGLRVLVEKPLAISADELTRYDELTAAFPDRPLQVGYLAPRYPQVQRVLDDLKSGRLGGVKGFVGLTLLSFITEHGSKRWEAQPEKSGGGVLMNSGGHVMSLVLAAFGEPTSVRSTTAKLFSERVEDSAVVELSYGDFVGTCFASWSIEGFPRQENRLLIWTDRGLLTLTNHTATWETHTNGERTDFDVAHQLDADVGFNLMPDYAGGGITAEHGDLQAAARRDTPPPMDLERASAIERMLFRCGRADAELGPGQSFDAQCASLLREATEVEAPPPPCESSADRKLVLDLRELPVSAAADIGLDAHGDGLLLTPDQAAALPRRERSAPQLRITVPDFLQQARRIAQGRPIELVSGWGLAGCFGAGAGALAGVARQRGVTFWAVARTLLGAALARLPRDLEGTVLVHAYLVDIALAVGRPREVLALTAACRRRLPRARVGVHTNLLGEACNLAALDPALGAVHFLSSPSASGLDETVRLVRDTNPDVELVAEVGPGPAALHCAAAADPGQWCHGADALVVGAAADARAAELRMEEVRRAWTAAFPGLDLPHGLV